MDKDKNNRNRKKTNEDAEDILGMIRKRQEQPDTDESSGSKLRDFLNNLHDEGTVEENYSETPIYRMGFSDGQQEGYDKGYNDAYYELFSVLKAIETIISPHVKQEC